MVVGSRDGPPGSPGPPASPPHALLMIRAAAAGRNRLRVCQVMLCGNTGWELTRNSSSFSADLRKRHQEVTFRTHGGEIAPKGRRATSCTQKRRVPLISLRVSSSLERGANLVRARALVPIEQGHRLAIGRYGARAEQVGKALAASASAGEAQRVSASGVGALLRIVENNVVVLVSVRRA